MNGEEFEVIRLDDPAIRWTGEGKTELDVYLKSRDRKDLVIRVGAEPTVYRCRRLRRSRMLLVDAATTEVEAYDRGFAHGVLEIRVPGQAPRKPAGDHWTADELEAVDWETIKEVGLVVLARSRVPFDCTPRYQVQRSSLDAWQLAVSRCAALSLETASPKPSEPGGPSGSATPKPETDAAGSASPTDASAAAPRPEAPTGA